jgi:hypothetical protein
MKRLILALLILTGTTHAQWISVVGSKTLSGSTPAATPTFSPGAGTYSSTQTVTISTTAGSVICYNTTGSPATNGTTGCTTGTLYSGAVSVSTSETLYAVSGGTGYTDSPVGSATYTISAGCTAIPYTDNFTPTGALNSSCWTQTTGTPSNLANCTQNSGFAIVASGKQCFAMFTGHAYGLTTSQSIQTALTWTASNYSGIGIMTIAGNGAVWVPRLDSVYNIVNGTGTDSAGGCSTGTSGDVIKFAVTGIVSGYGTVTVTDVTTSTTLCTLPGIALGGGGSQQYPTIFVDETGATGEKAGPATMN